MVRAKKRNILVRIIFNPKILIFLGIIIVIAISIPVSKNISKKYNIDQEILELEKEIGTLEAANTDLKKMITYLESDYFVEEQARLNLGLKKEGEEVVVIESAGEKIGINQGGILADGFSKRDSFYPFAWWDYFFEKRRFN